jgi:hypothetical protein
MVLDLLLCCLLWVSACTPGWMPTATPAPTPVPPRATPTWVPPTPEPSPAVVATPTPDAHPIPKGAMDAFAVTYFPWADSPALPMYTGEGKATVINSIFFAAPPFLGFDINPPEGWLHVVGVESWAAVNGELISPLINPYRRFGDSDRVLLHGHVRGEFVIASYVGLEGQAPYYYRSLLHADELRGDRLPAAYDGLDVWVRGLLDVKEGQGRFYVLPEGATFDPSYLGREALVAGRLVIDDSIHVQATRGIYVPEDGDYAQILPVAHLESATTTYERGIIRTLGPGAASLTIETSDGRSVTAEIGQSTRIVFSDGSAADAAELAIGRDVDIVGKQAAGQDVMATEVTIFGTTTGGPTYAAYASGPNGDLWTVSLDGLDRRQITHLAAPAAGLEDAEISPDGERFAFGLRDGPQSTLVIGNLRNGELQEWLADDPWQETAPIWSPDGSRLAFVRHRLQDEQRVDGGLHILTIRSGETRRATAPAPEGWRTIEPRWSPDGKHIAYGQVPDDPTQPPTLYVLSFPAQTKQIFEWCSDWRWGHDSSQLTCTRQTSIQGRARIWVVQRDGTSPTWVTPTGAEDHHGRWSPDGTALALLSRPSGSGGPDHLWIMRSDGMRRFRPQAQPRAGNLAWSPDSQAAVFMRESATGANSGLWLVERDGSALLPLAPEATALVGTYCAP